MGDTTPQPATAAGADMATADQVNAFVQRWTDVQLTDATELSVSQTFVIDLCDLLGVPRPLATRTQGYQFERPVTFLNGDGSTQAGRIDCYKQGAFVWESKKLRYVQIGSKRFDSALMEARAQAEGYARALPASEGRPPFLIVADVGNVIELYAEFSRSGATYTPFPDPRNHRIRLADLAKAEVRQRLRQIWLDPDSLNPARASARVTREVAAHLANLATSMERSGHRADHVAAYLTRCLFSMFAEDVELLPKGSFLGLLQTHRANPATLTQMLRALWMDMDRGGFSSALAHQVLRFNGKLFKSGMSDGYSLLLNSEQIDLLITAAKSNWREVEPAIFGTLLERALAPTERHALGAHYTPRAYVERLVMPTVIAPLRADWANTQVAALLLVEESDHLKGKAAQAKLAEAVTTVRQFLHQLCTLRVLDPACGSGNFLYVTLEHLKRLEGEVINQLEALGETQDSLGLDGDTVTPQQLLGLEINERAAALAELVLWIGYLQWHIRTRGNKAVSEPVVHDYGNIECRDAVLAYDDLEPAHDAAGVPLLRWDGHTTKPHPVTGLPVPDEQHLTQEWRYVKPRKASWPKADFIVGNPPFIGNKRMRDALGDGYVSALRSVWRDVPESADFVMYWWHHAAEKTAKGLITQFGLITTNSLTMIFNRRVVQSALDNDLSLQFAIPDHPWVDSASGAAVRIAMTVAKKSAEPGRLLTVIGEAPALDGEVDVELIEHKGRIFADLSVGANVASAKPLRANSSLSSRGVIPHGAGFTVTPEQAADLGLGTTAGLERHIRPYRNGKDLTDKPRGFMVIDLHGMSSEQVRFSFPKVYQWLLERVKPDRDQNPRPKRRDYWWLFAENQPRMRASIAELTRYIATGQVAKHRVFQFLEGRILPDDKLIAVASDRADLLGILSSGIHVAWALALGGHLGVGNDPVYSKTTCFETFPFPDTDTGLTPELRQRIAATAEQIDAHRKRQQAAHPGLTLTGMYNVLEALKAGRALTDKEKTIHTQGLVAVLKELHDELDAAVLAAYGWADLPASQWLDNLVALNAQRAAEEATGTVRWLRPEFQCKPQAASKANLQADLLLNSEQTVESGHVESAVNLQNSTTAQATEQQAWPTDLPEQVRAVADTLSAAPDGLTLAQVEARFKGRGAWKKSLPRILDTLAVLGRARCDAAAGGGSVWRG